MATDDRPSKGTYGRARLPIARSYVIPRGRSWLLGLSGIAAALVAVVLVVSFRTSPRLISNGPLSSAHATLEGNCSACHTPGGEVSNEKCALCHEKFGDALGLYTFNAHYVYASGDRTRAVTQGGEVPCVACHDEHRGRAASAIVAPDARCLACHEGHAFATDHPEFEFAAQAIPDPAGLAFAHIAHVARVMDRQGLDDLEQACLACHYPSEDGRRFEPISFDAHCATCHLGPEIETPALPILQPGRRIVTEAADGVRLDLGVETIDTIRTRLGPGEQWALSASTGQFDVVDGEVIKVGVEHADPWVMHNLSLIRRALYPSSDLPLLLKASADVPAPDRRRLYDEAADTLRQYADGLRGEPEDWVQAELDDLDAILATVDRRLADRNTALNDARFRLALVDARLTPEQIDALNAFATTVAAPCVTCHQISRATIHRVQTDQRTLRRAQFNHRAHVLQRGCLDCHTEIPFLEYLGTTEKLPASIDGAQLQNLPRIARCRECHVSSVASERCLTCHEFHPSTHGWSRLLLDVR